VSCGDAKSGEMAGDHEDGDPSAQLARRRRVIIASGLAILLSVLAAVALLMVDNSSRLSAGGSRALLQRAGSIDVPQAVITKEDFAAARAAVVSQRFFLLQRSAISRQTLTCWSWPR
jgi:hypothetical protein